MEGESSFDFDLRQLQGFVSDSIFQFLSDETTPLCQELPFDGSSTPTSTEADLDNLLLACSDSYEATAKRPRLSVPPPAKVRAFASPKTGEEVEQARKNAMPKKTQDDTKYCVGIWNEWRQHKELYDGNIIPAVDELNPAALAKLLSHFTLEVRKKNGDEFPPNSLHHIICGIQRYLRMNGKPAIDFFNDPTFADFKMNLDAEMKRLQKKGLGSTKRQAEPLSIEEEELLWSKGLLGSETPQALVDTILYMNGLYFALRSGEEHRQLRFSPCQIELVERTGQRPFLRYTEDISKNHPGGLKGRKTKPKIVTHYANVSNPERCFVRLFKMYSSLCPPGRPMDAFYLLPLPKPRPDCWFSTKPIGRNTLDRTVARLCQKAGIPGYRTNHSLRATTATRLYQAGVDEHFVMERTGHRSLEGVRSYKRTSMAQQENLSDILNSGAGSSVSHRDQEDANNLAIQLNTNTCSTNNSLAMKVTQPTSFNFHSCSVTINYATPQ